ncbi:MAG: hypothetical protein JRN42_08835 [Nitrososphaerota archaeon]|nr:hypothetical protein [Nitrososphaerota archaeon]
MHDYKCENCGEVEERKEHDLDGKLRCGRCGAAMRKVWAPFNFRSMDLPGYGK